MFCTDEFIALSRKFTCVRIETFESDESREMVRGLLGGKLTNTAFCILSPDGEKQLSRTARSPMMAFAGGSEWKSKPGKGNQEVIKKLEAFTQSYPQKGDLRKAVIPDFHSFEQALNVASADQRLLLFMVAHSKDRDELAERAKLIVNQQDVFAKFHVDVASDVDVAWTDVVTGTKLKSGYFIIRADAFGQKGSVMAQLSLTATAEQVRAALVDSNKKFVMTEKPKNFNKHIALGAELGIVSSLKHDVDKDKDGNADEGKERKFQSRNK